ncbi:Glu-tRNA(Gln) amidotransferase subunit GatD [Candidatus Woesearchaeota archaeon]|nr:Glu-tRNA(Gln) amidotransferase subunit GatD [Candidatus Woesearchaeota archaeon]
MDLGDYIEVRTDSEVFKGTLMPDSLSNKLILKLDSGYNIGIDKKKIKEKKVIKEMVQKERRPNKIKFSKELPTILILHTGGTIASKVSYKTGGVIAKFSPEEILELFPEISNIANIKTKLISNIFSEDMGFKDYNKLVLQIKRECKNVEGIIITHGTDTMHYTSAALSFMLENLGFPVILVGSQRSSDRGSSDAALNLVCAAQFIVKSNYAGVAICMHSSMNDDNCYILPGLKVKKLHSSRRDAFQTVNSKPIATVNFNGEIKYISHDFMRKDKSKELVVNLLSKNLKIGILKVHPNMHYSEISKYKTFDGLIIEGTGLGHVPINENVKVYNALKSLNIPIVMTSQTVFGRVNLNVYSTGRKLQEFVLSGSDMTSETAFVKLAWLLSNKKDVKLISSNLKGEINERISDEFLKEY